MFTCSKGPAGLLTTQAWHAPHSKSSKFVQLQESSKTDDPAALQGPGGSRVSSIVGGWGSVFYLWNHICSLRSWATAALARLTHRFSSLELRRHPVRQTLHYPRIRRTPPYKLTLQHPPSPLGPPCGAQFQLQGRAQQEPTLLLRDPICLCPHCAPLRSLRSGQAVGAGTEVCHRGRQNVP